MLCTSRGMKFQGVHVVENVRNISFFGECQETLNLCVLMQLYTLAVPFMLPNFHFLDTMSLTKIPLQFSVHNLHTQDIKVHLISKFDVELQTSIL